jgi:hypothetical protein
MSVVHFKCDGPGPHGLGVAPEPAGLGSEQGDDVVDALLDGKRGGEQPPEVPAGDGTEFGRLLPSFWEVESFQSLAASVKMLVIHNKSSFS